MAPTVEENKTETLPAVAALMREWLPELHGRAIPITEADLRTETVAGLRLPLAVVYPLRQVFTHTGGFSMTVEEEFVIEVWLEPAREKTEKGESPFWSYYEYNTFRNKLFSRFAAERSPQNGTYQFISMDVDSNLLATVIAFRMKATYEHCADAVSELEEPATITFQLCKPASSGCLT